MQTLWVAEVLSEKRLHRICNFGRNRRAGIEI
jgi:hypothetical protein